MRVVPLLLRRFPNVGAKLSVSYLGDCYGRMDQLKGKSAGNHTGEGLALPPTIG